MPQAPNHEYKVIPLTGSRFVVRVECTGCNWQSHCLPEEDADAKGKQHQRNWGYLPNPKQAVKAEPNLSPKTPATVTTPSVPQQPTSTTVKVTPTPASTVSGIKMAEKK